MLLSLLRPLFWVGNSFSVLAYQRVSDSLAVFLSNHPVFLWIGLTLSLWGAIRLPFDIYDTFFAPEVAKQETSEVLVEKSDEIVDRTDEIASRTDVIADRTDEIADRTHKLEGKAGEIIDVQTSIKGETEGLTSLLEDEASRSETRDSEVRQLIADTEKRMLARIEARAAEIKKLYLQSTAPPIAQESLADELDEIFDLTWFIVNEKGHMTVPPLKPNDFENIDIGRCDERLGQPAVSLSLTYTPVDVTLENSCAGLDPTYPQMFGSFVNHFTPYAFALPGLNIEKAYGVGISSRELDFRGTVLDMSK